MMMMCCDVYRARSHVPLTSPPFTGGCSNVLTGGCSNVLTGGCSNVLTGGCSNVLQLAPAQPGSSSDVSSIRACSI